jgi:hypothetical protein
VVRAEVEILSDARAPDAQGRIREAVEDEPDSSTFDLVLKNNPTFIANTAKHYLFIQEIGNDSAKYGSRASDLRSEGSPP